MKKIMMISAALLVFALVGNAQAGGTCVKKVPCTRLDQTCMRKAANYRKGCLGRAASYYSRCRAGYLACLLRCRRIANPRVRQACYRTCRKRFASTLRRCTAGYHSYKKRCSSAYIAYSKRCHKRGYKLCKAPRLSPRTCSNRWTCGTCQ